MAITRVKTSSILQNFPKERSMLAGNDGDTGAYESIATVLVGSGGVTEVTFTSIPQTYQHLQLRYIGQIGTGGDNARVTINSDTSSNYAYHLLYGNGSGAFSSAAASSPNMLNFNFGAGSNNGSIFAAGIVDILDYTNTNKYKTLKALCGADKNGSGEIFFNSGLWQSTSAITSITVGYNGTVKYNQNTHIALYGIR